MTSYESEIIKTTPITAQEKCKVLGKTRVTVEFLNIRNNTFYYTGILVIFSLIGILLTWYLLTSRESMILKWILIITFVIIIGLAIYLSVDTKNLFNCLSVVTNTLKAS